MDSGRQYNKMMFWHATGQGRQGCDLLLQLKNIVILMRWAYWSAIIFNSKFGTRQPIRAQLLQHILCQQKYWSREPIFYCQFSELRTYHGRQFNSDKDAWREWHCNSPFWWREPKRATSRPMLATSIIVGLAQALDRSQRTPTTCPGMPGGDRTAAVGGEAHQLRQEKRGRMVSLTLNIYLRRHEDNYKDQITYVQVSVHVLLS